MRPPTSKQAEATEEKLVSPSTQAETTRTGNRDPKDNGKQVLRRMTRKEAQRRWEQAKAAGKIHQPLDLREAWGKEHRSSLRIEDFVRMTRELLTSKELDDPSSAPGRIALAFEALTHRFELLVKAGAFDEVLPSLTALPLLYAPTAGTGAREWKQAEALFDEKRLATKTRIRYRGTDSHIARNPVWGQLAEAAERLIQQSIIELAEPNTVDGSYRNWRSHAVAWKKCEVKRPRATKVVSSTIFLLDDGSILHWHSWLDLLADPATPREKVLRSVIDDFFAHPINRSGDELLAPSVRAGKARTQAVNDARKSILRAAAAL